MLTSKIRWQPTIRTLLDTLLLDCIQITDDRALVCRHCEARIEADKNQPIPHDEGCVVGQILALLPPPPAAKEPKND